MMRAIFCTVFLLFLGQATGALAALTVDRCSADCSDEAPDESCPFGCSQCACCRLVAVPPAAPTRCEPEPIALPTNVDRVAPRAPVTPATPDPREILRVPI